MGSSRTLNSVLTSRAISRYSRPAATQLLYYVRAISMSNMQSPIEKPNDMVPNHNDN